MELGESTSAGAARETQEEAGAIVEIGPLYSLLNVPHAEQVHLFYLATMTSPEFHAGEESLEVALFHEQDIPWNDIAFPTVKQTLEWFFADRAAGLFDLDTEFSVRSRDILPSEKI
jgi:ADP-ribose pyrophosphatase YjhB (NUDIX family)